MPAVINREKQRLSSNLTLQELGQAMKSLNLADLPPENRRAALADHLAMIMIDSIHDRQKAVELASARVMHRASRQ